MQAQRRVASSCRGTTFVKVLKLLRKVLTLSRKGAKQITYTEAKLRFVNTSENTPKKQLYIVQKENVAKSHKLERIRLRLAFEPTT